MKDVNYSDKGGVQMEQFGIEVEAVTPMPKRLGGIGENVPEVFGKHVRIVSPRKTVVAVFCPVGCEAVLVKLRKAVIQPSQVMESIQGFIPRNHSEAFEEKLHRECHADHVRYGNAHIIRGMQQRHVRCVEILRVCENVPRRLRLKRLCHSSRLSDSTPSFSPTPHPVSRSPRLAPRGLEPLSASISQRGWAQVSRCRTWGKNSGKKRGVQR